MIELAPIKCVECGLVEMVELDPETQGHLFDSYLCPDCSGITIVGEPQPIQENPAYIA